MAIRIYSEYAFNRRWDFKYLTPFAIQFWTDIVEGRRHFGMNLTLLGFELALNTMRQDDY